MSTRSSSHGGFLARMPLLLLLALSGLVARADGQAMPTPVSVQVPLLLKILSFDRALADRVAGEIVVGVLYQGRFRSSTRVADEARDAFAEPQSTLAARKVRVVAIDLDTVASLQAALVSGGVHVLYVAPLRAVDIRDVAASTSGSHVTTMTGVPAYVDEGVAVGIDVRGDRPQIMVNLPAARAAGAEFSSQLLRVARVTGDAESSR